MQIRILTVASLTIFFAARALHAAEQPSRVEKLGVFEWQDDAVGAVALSVDGKYLAGGGVHRYEAPCHVALWDLAARERRFLIDVPAMAICKVVFVRGGQSLALTAIDSQALRATGRQVRAAPLSLGLAMMDLRLPTDGAFAFACLRASVPQGELDVLARRLSPVSLLDNSLALDQAVYSVTTESLEEFDETRLLDTIHDRSRVGFRTPVSPAMKPSALAFHFKLLAIACDDDKAAPELRVWGIDDLKPQFVLPMSAHKIVALTFTPGSREIVIGDVDGGVRLWDLEKSEATVLAKPPAARSVIREMRFSGDGHRLAVFDRETVNVWSWPDFERLATIPARNSDCFALSKDGAMVAVGDSYTPFAGLFSERARITVWRIAAK